MTTNTDYVTVEVDHAYPIYDSSFVEFLAYNGETKRAYVQLATGTYVYSGVEEDAFKALYEADSVGHAFHEFARNHGPYTEFYSEGEIYYTAALRDQMTIDEAVDEAEGEAENVFTLVPGTAENTEDDGLSSLFSDLLPSAEEVEEANLRRRREMALAAAAASVAGAKNPVSSSAVLARAEDFEGYLANG